MIASMDQCLHGSLPALTIGKTSVLKEGCRTGRGSGLNESFAGFWLVAADRWVAVNPRRLTGQPFPKRLRRRLTASAGSTFMAAEG
jgi:hypothetical protein